MILKTLVFSINWPKLDDRLFTTLRKTCYFNFNEKVQVHIRPTNKRFFATVLFKSKQELLDISTSLITYDTNTKTREEAFKVLQKFYHNTIDENTEFYLLLLQKEDQ